MTFEARRIFPAATIVWTLGFLVWSWRVGGGVPAFIDPIETVLTVVHARNLIEHNPFEFSWLTAETIDPEAPVVTGVYTHNANFPRYLHYLLFLLGINKASTQILILGLAGSTMGLVLAWKACGEQPIVPIAMSCDFIQFLAWTGNTYRVWTFPLLWAGVLASRRVWRPWHAGLLAFALYQFEYGFAVFVTTVVGILCLLLGWRRRVGMMAGFGIGAALSLALFGIQVLTYFGGFEEARAELVKTVGRRGLVTAAPGHSLPIRFLAAGVAGFGDAAKMISPRLASRTNFPAEYNDGILVLVVLGIAGAAVRVVRRDSSMPAPLLIAILGGMFVASAVLRGYYSDAYLRSHLPFFGFPIWVSLGVVAEDLVRLTRFPAASIALVVPILASSWLMYKPPFPGQVFKILERDFKGRSILTPSHYYVYALTGGRTFPIPPGHPTPDEIPTLVHLREPDGRIAVVCIDLVTGGAAIQRGNIGNECGLFINPLIKNGHRVARAGKGYSIVEIAVPVDWKPPTRTKVVSVKPHSGRGLSETFEIKVAHGAGATALAEIDFVINSPEGSPPSCWLQFVRPANRVLLQNDAGSAWLPEKTVGAPGSLGNSRCALNLRRATVEVDGSDLTLSLPLTFNAGFGGVKTIRALTVDTNRETTGWQTMGSWRVQ